MKDTCERQLRAFIAERIRSRPKGKFVITADDGVIGMTGSVESGLLRRSKLDVCDLPQDFTELIRSSFEASKSLSNGPWYHLDIQFSPANGTTFSYYWQGDALHNLSTVKLDTDSCLPNFIFRKRFDREVLSAISNEQISTAILLFVPSELQRKNAILSTLLDLYATVDWQADSNNGSLNQYFARDKDPYGNLDRTQLYPATLRGLEAIGHIEAVRVFRDALAAYAHFYPRVEAVRSELQIPSILSPDQSNAINEYWNIEQELNSLRAAYVRVNMDNLLGSNNSFKPT